jgi:hypothetical protein
VPATVRSAAVTGPSAVRRRLAAEVTSAPLG